MNWLSLFGTLTVAQVVSTADQSRGNETEVSPRMKRFLEVVLDSRNKSEQLCGLHPQETEWRKPLCKLNEGCDVLLKCHNYSNSTEQETGKTVKVTPIQLEKILENPSINNTCAVVMFYAPYCPYSTQFGRTFNALGRSYTELPVLAVDFSENNPYKYLAVYVPIVNFYYRGKVIFRFSALESLEELVTQVSLMTNFTALTVNISDLENEFPVPTIRVDGDKWYLIAASVWVTFVIVVHICCTATVKLWLSRVAVRLKSLVQIVL